MDESDGMGIKKDKRDWVSACRVLEVEGTKARCIKIERRETGA